MDRTKAIDHLKGLLSPDDTVYLILRHVSASGMTRWISPLVFREGRAMDLTYAVCATLGIKRSEIHEGVRLANLGDMDLGFHLLYELGQALFPEGFDIQTIGRNGDISGHEPDGGYAFNREWL
ncbi:hypothetical protein LCGC14_0313030 [marine sediment metagenome]|uniref:Uncharacterized protein n=1 Tax=marine sediment metagenome TaxID=412755 RepID=A0A0F9W8N4_9ZZZZ